MRNEDLLVNIAIKENFGNSDYNELEFNLNIQYVKKKKKMAKVFTVKIWTLVNSETSLTTN